MAQTYSAPTTVTGTNGNVVFSSAGFDTLVGGTGNDSIYAWNGGNSLLAGSGNQTLISQSGNDTLVAGAGNDTLISAAGNDTMVGGTGNTTFVVGSSTDVIQALSSGSNINTVLASVSYVAPANVQDLTGTGNSDITLTGNDLNNVITANSGNDTLIAGTGIATLVGGAGNDIFLVNNVNDVVQATYTGSNTNTVIASVDYVLPENVQNLQLMTDNSVGTGNDMTNNLVAIGSNDTLIAGSGVATMSGYGQNETFVVNNTADVVQAMSAGGNTVQTSVDYTAPDNVQNLTGTGSADITLTGNNLGDVITANSGNDTLIGGTGNDTLVGGAGLDTFSLDYGTGVDTVIDASLQGGAIQLGNNVNLDYLTATQQGNDLLLQIDSTDSMLIQGYYTNPQSTWTIQDANGNTVTADQAIQNTATQNKKMAQLESDFVKQTTTDIGNMLSGSGYGQINANTYYTYNIPTLIAIYTTNTTTTTVSNFSPPASGGADVSGIVSFYTGGYAGYPGAFSFISQTGPLIYVQFRRPGAI